MTEAKAKILVVDDSLVMRKMFEGMFGYEYDVSLVKDGEEALLYLNEKTLPDLIVLDIVMPKKDGFQVCEEIKEQDRLSHIPIIFVTGKTEPEEEALGFEMGGVDFITKPINPIVVLARIRTHIDLVLSHRKLENSNTLLNTDLDEIKLVRDRLNYERETVEGILARMRANEAFINENIASIMEPLESSSGDILLSAKRPHGAHHILMGDFTGHGLSAALAGPMVSDIFYDMTNDGYSADRIIAEINDKLAIKLPADMYLAGAFMEVNTEHHMVTIWNGGIPPVAIVSPSGEILQIKSHHMPMGILPSTSIKPNGKAYPIHPGDKLYAYSDGITEVTNNNKEMFGTDRLEKLFVQVTQGDLAFDQIIETVNNFQGENIARFDDMTLVEYTHSTDT